MKNLSSETLFHFMSEKEHLFELLASGFKPRYVEEKFPFEENQLKLVGIPMLCFCDIRLSEVRDHIDWYGKYGIGMRSSWGTQNGLTPVQYYNKNSHLIKEYSSGLKSMRKSFKSKTYGEMTMKETPGWYFDLYKNVWYMKEFKGKQYHRKTRKEKRKKFYDEREWRYIPKMKDLKDLPEGQPMSLLDENLLRYRSDFNYRKEVNDGLGSIINLSFTPKDIAYIIVAKEDERSEIIRIIKDKKLKNYSNEEVAVLSSKILSIEQIMSDF